MAVSPPQARTLTALRNDIRLEVAKAVIGYEDAIDLLIAATIAGGHVLLEGPPGVAKTALARATAQVLGISFKRVQFTPDTTPDHIIGHNASVMGEGRFVPGAVFTNLLLADEINRTPPRTQAALLEAMQERHVTYDGKTHWLPSPFMVIATQNPYEHEGVYPLPESQLDRFLFKIDLAYLDARSERDILRLPHRGLAPDVIGEIQPLLDVAGLDTAQRQMDSTQVSDEVADFAVAVVRATRRDPAVELGAGPRALIHLIVAAKATACLEGRDTVTLEDVRRIAQQVLSHRLIVQSGSRRDVVARALDAATRSQ